MRKQQTKQTKIALYARVSTADKHQDFKVQLDDLISKADTWCPVSLPIIENKTQVTLLGGTTSSTVRLYVDKQTASGKKARPSFDQLLKDVANHKAHIVIAWKMDRMFRSTREFVLVTNDVLAQHKARLILVTQGLDWDFAESNPTAKLLAGILAVIAEFEHSLISERVKAGMAHAKSKGKHVGRQSIRGVTSGRLSELQELMTEQNYSYNDCVKYLYTKYDVDISKTSLMRRMKDYESGQD